MSTLSAEQQAACERGLLGEHLSDADTACMDAVQREPAAVAWLQQQAQIDAGLRILLGPPASAATPMQVLATIRARQHQRRQRMRRAWAIAALLALAAGGAWLVLPTAPPQPVIAQLDQPGEIRTAQGAIHRGNEVHATDQVQATGTLALAPGLGQIELAGRVTAPATPAGFWRLDDGRLTAHIVPHQPNPWGIVTDEGTVTVLGTIFTVRRAVATGTEVSVGRGLVRCTTPACSLALAAGESASMHADGQIASIHPPGTWRRDIPGLWPTGVIPVDWSVEPLNAQDGPVAWARIEHQGIVGLQPSAAARLRVPLASQPTHLRIRARWLPDQVGNGTTDPFQSGMWLRFPLQQKRRADVGLSNMQKSGSAILLSYFHLWRTSNSVAGKATQPITADQWARFHRGDWFEVRSTYVPAPQAHLAGTLTFLGDDQPTFVTDSRFTDLLDATQPAMTIEFSDRAWAVALVEAGSP